METQKTKRIIVVDNHPIVLEGLSALFRNQPQVELLSTASHGAELRTYLESLVPDVIILELKLSNTNIYRLIKDLIISYPKVKLIAFSHFTIPKLIQDVMDFGVNAYLSKSVPLQKITEAVERVARGETYICQSVYSIGSLPKSNVANSILTPEENFEAFAELTEREHDVIILLSRGYTNQEIADKLALSLDSIDSHRKQIMEKLNLNATSQLLNFANQQGLA